MKIHLNQTEIEKAIIEKYVNPNVDWHEMTDKDELQLTVDIKATRGVEGFTCDIVIGEDHSDKPLGIQRAVEEARNEPAAPKDTDTSVDTQNGAQQPAESNPNTQATEQAPEAPKRRGRPPGSKNKATLEAEAQANDTAGTAAPEEVAEAVQDEGDKPEPTPFVKSGGLFSNRKTEAQPEPEQEEAPFTDNSGDDAISEEPEPTEEATLAAEAARTEPQEEPTEAPVEEAPAKPTRSLFGNLNRNN